jgi:hypothetical protein
MLKVQLIAVLISFYSEIEQYFSIERAMIWIAFPGIKG